MASLWVMSVVANLSSSSVSAGDRDRLQLVDFSPDVLGGPLALV